MSDLIDRQAAIETLSEYGNGRTVYIGAEEAIRRIEQLPPAQPERKTGKWRYSRNISSISYSDMMITCDQCGYTKERSHGDVFNFCPSCGARMEGNT